MIVGYGPVGRTVTRLLRDNDIEPVIVELNLETVRRLREEGLTAVYGDARQARRLASGRRRPGREPDPQRVRDLRGRRGDPPGPRAEPDGVASWPARRYLRELAALHKAGAEVVFSGEGEVALAMTEAILHRLGATPEQIDRERERVHAELFGQTRQGVASGGTPSRSDE